MYKMFGGLIVLCIFDILNIPTIYSKAYFLKKGNKMSLGLF